MQLPKDARVQGRIDAAAVDLDEQLVRGVVSVEATGRDRIFTGVDALHLQVGRLTQHFRDRGGSSARYVLVRDDVDRSRRAAQRLVLL